jgi:hypothetical protein
MDALRGSAADLMHTIHTLLRRIAQVFEKPDLVHCIENNPHAYADMMALLDAYQL